MDCFLTLQNQLFEQLNSLWESDDEEILEKIDELLLQEGSNYSLSLNEKANLRKELFRSIRKLDVLQELLEDTSITEIMVNGWDKIFIEREGHLITWNKTFTSSGKLEDVIQQIVARCNRVINTLHPIVDARLENGARVNAVIPPISVDGPILTIRQFPKEAITMKTLLENRSVFVILAMTLLFAASISEVFKSSYQALPKGQLEAGLSIGLTDYQTFVRILLPQAFRIALPNITTAIINLLKDIALAYTIGLVDLMGAGNLVISRNLGNYSLETYTAVAIIYWVLALILAVGTHFIENELDTTRG